uniref:DND microRNA-mediated repression inhibitor 1 n=1 Tax=Electrophorus electricus TaxID=8005 RepID=A0AAY5ELW0_ELEEL
MERGRLQVLSTQRRRSFEDWLESTSITLTQVNGQRKYGGPPTGWRGPAPGPGCEVFISSIPRDVFEDCLIPLFQTVAPLYEFRLMMNFSGQNRGFAYAKYGRPADAEAAIRALHLHPLRGGMCLIVKMSTEKRQLCLGELPAGVSEEALLTVLRMVSDGVRGVTVRVAGPRGKATSALVFYSSHYAASMAKKVLVQAFKKQYGVSISVRWFSGSSKPRHDESEEEGALACPGPKPVGQALLTAASFQLARSAFRDPHPQLFSRVVGGPAPQASSGEAVPHDAVGRLRRLCELYGLGLPIYDVRYHHTSADGFLCVSYSVLVPGLPMPFCGVAQVLPGPSTNTTEEEARRTAAEQVLKAMSRASILRAEQLL